MDKKIVVCSCTEFGYEIIDFLLANGVTISHLVTLSPEQAIKYKVSGYKSLEPLSKKYNVSIYYPELYSMKESDFGFFEKEKFDLLLVCGWQRLIPKKILDTIKICGIGSHGSSELLPKGRGRSPVNWSIIEGKKQFILQLFMLTPGVDDGDLVYHETFDINEWDTCKTIYYKTSIVMKKSLLKLIPNILSNEFSRIPQSGEPSFYPKRTPDDGLIDWSKSLTQIHNFVKALTKPYPGAFSFLGKQKIMIWEAQPFDTKISFPNSRYGEIVEKFSSGDLVIKCMDGLLLVTNYEGNVECGDVFSNL